MYREIGKDRLKIVQGGTPIWRLLCQNARGECRFNSKRKFLLTLVIQYLDSPVHYALSLELHVHVATSLYMTVHVAPAMQASLQNLS